MEVQNICDILIETYNVNKFDSAATDLKDAVYKEAQRCSTTYPMKIYENKIDTRTHDSRPLHEHIKEDRLWGEIRIEARTNKVLQAALDRAILVYHLSKNNGKE